MPYPVAAARGQTVVPPPAAGGSLTSLTLFGSAAATGAGIVVSAAAEAGMVAVMVDFVHNIALSPTSVLPTGFTLIDERASGEWRAIISYRILDGDDEGDTITGMLGTDFSSKIMLVFEGDIPIASITATMAATSVMVSTNPAAQTVDVTGKTAPLIAFGVSADGDATPVATLTGSTAYDAEVDEGTRTTIGYKIHNSSPVNHTVDCGDAGTFNYLAAFQLECAG